MAQLLLHHLCIQTNDYAASLTFYQQVLEMQILEETAGFHGRAYNTWLKKGDFMIELQTPKADGWFESTNQNCAGLAHFCFWIEDIEACYNEIYQRAQNAFLLHNGQAIYEVNGGKLFKIKAPEGTIIEFRNKKDC